MASGVKAKIQLWSALQSTPTTTSSASVSSSLAGGVGGPSSKLVSGSPFLSGQTTMGAGGDDGEEDGVGGVDEGKFSRKLSMGSLYSTSSDASTELMRFLAVFVCSTLGAAWKKRVWKRRREGNSGGERDH
ncbi:hypothetical protein HDU67_003752 [Dinochytrium kinnereticum]|nr:hypothetical protein HDU67_003752 [Dinochytrium kinnereticum]